MDIFVLLIRRDPEDGGMSRRALERHGDGVFRLQCVTSIATGVARIGGGGIDVIMLDLSLRDDLSSDRLAGFLEVRKAAPHVPVVVLYDAQDEGLALRAMRAGAADYLLTEACGHSTTDSITLVIRSAVGWGRKLNASRKVSETARPGGAIAFMGSKGGVGATTVALNIAAVLAKHSTVILVEMRPAFGSLLPYLMPFGRIRNISQLLRSEAKEVSAAEAGACLWPCKNVPGLSVLFGPQLASECVEFAPDRVTSLIKMLAGLADFVVLDLPPSLSEANRAAVEAAGRLLVVSERDPVCVQAAKLMIQSMQAWPGTPPIEVILVNRSAVSCPMPLSDIEAQLGFPAIGLVPPGPEICLAAQQAHVPLIEYQAESLIADSLSALADKCASRLRTLPSWPDGSRGSSREALASAGVMHAE